jgi:hypothetical protein
VAILPPEDPIAATDEVYRLAKHGGLRQANLQIARATPRIHDESWEPLWTAFAIPSCLQRPPGKGEKG